MLMRWIVIGGLAVSLAACSQQAQPERSAQAATAPAAATPANAPAATDVAGAETFLRERLSIYAENPPEPTEEYGSEADAERAMAADRAATFTPALAALMAADRARTPEGEAPTLDFQPLCGCNDDSLVRVAAIRATPVEGGRVNAAVDFTSGTERFSRRFLLERTPAGWRIADAFGAEPDDRGLVALLTPAG